MIKKWIKIKVKVRGRLKIMVKVKELPKIMVKVKKWKMLTKISNLNMSKIMWMIKNIVKLRITNPQT